MIAFNSFDLNEDMIYLIEALKVESYWSSKTYTLTLQNKDISFLNNIERIVKNLKMNISKRLLLKISLEDNTKKDEITLYLKDKKLNFHIEKSPFDQNKVKAVTSLPYKKNYNLLLTSRNKKFPIKINFLKNKIKYKSDLPCWLYGDIRFPAKKFLDFLDLHCGRDKNLSISKFLFNSNERLVMSSFSALLDCEGSIDWYGLKRLIRIRMRNKNYLKQWSNLLNKYNIGNKIRKNKFEWELNIAGWEDFDRLEKMGLNLQHSKKIEKWNKMMNGFKRNQISRGTYREFYKNKLKELNKKTTVEEFASYLKKSKRVVNHYLLKLEREKSISCNRTKKPHLYFIST